MCILCLELENTTCTVELKSFFSALLPFDEDSTSTVFKPGQGSGFDSRSLNRSISDQDSSPGHLRDRNILNAEVVTTTIYRGGRHHQHLKCQDLLQVPHSHQPHQVPPAPLSQGADHWVACLYLRYEVPEVGLILATESSTGR